MAEPGNGNEVHANVDVTHHSEHPRTLPVLLMVILVALAITLVAGIVLAVRQGQTNDRFSASQAVLLNVQREACDRGNDARQQQLIFFDKLIAGNKARRDAWKFYFAQIATLGQAVTGAPVEKFALQQIAANELEINGLKETERAYVNAQRAVSAYPAADDLHQRAIVDCAMLYPR